ncbi:MAG: phospholipase D family protein [Flavobacteriales bacterium]
MSEFLTGKALEEKLTDIIWHAKKHILIVSPFIKLDDYIKGVFEKIKTRHDVRLYLVFGKNPENRSRSIHKKDFEFFSEFKNVIVTYHEDLHAKHYCNEQEGLITSLNLYDYSMINNIEFGVHFTKNRIGQSNIFNETSEFTNKLLFDESELVYAKVPIYSKSLFGLKKEYQESRIIFDNSKDFFRSSKRYDPIHLNSIDLDKETSFEDKYDEKPQREQDQKEDTKSYENTRKTAYNKPKGYCIRTGEKIKFNVNSPMSYESWQTWAQFENYDYPESYCHETGEKSYGKTSMRNPVLGKTYRKSW